MKLTINLLLILLIALPAYAQQTGTITGKVVDAKTKQPLVGDNFVIMDTFRDASTDLEGNYVINRVPVGTYRLKFMYIGYNSVLKTDIVVKTAVPAYVNAELEETVIDGSEVTVTAGYFVEEQKIQTFTKTIDFLQGINFLKTRKNSLLVK